jgi:hypothetical protein
MSTLPPAYHRRAPNVEATPDCAGGATIGNERDAGARDEALAPSRGTRDATEAKRRKRLDLAIS